MKLIEYIIRLIHSAIFLIAILLYLVSLPVVMAVSYLISTK